MTIALVIPSLPGYSETFLTNKIAGLKASGFNVILMVVGVSVKRDMTVPVFYQPILAASGLRRWLYSFLLIAKSIVVHPQKSLKLLQEAKKAGYKHFGKWRMLAVLSNFLKIKTDWVHFAYATMAVERAFIGKVLYAKVGLSFRGYDISIHPVVYPAVYDEVWPHIDRVHSISEDLVILAKSHGMPEDMPVSIIHPAIDTSLVGAESRTFKHDKLRILSVGRLHWKKGFEYTLEALAMLEIEFEYTIIGEGSERERLVFAAYQLGILDKVNFVGKKDHIEVIEAMRQNDIYLQYSVQEGFCNAVLEAQASGMHCIVSDAEALSENVLDGETGWVIAKRNPVLLAESLKHVSEVNAYFKLKVSESAKERVKQNFGLELQKDKFATFYNG